ncbi:hypothetical protein LA080_011722 [Diaporthe eres]|nr:hypothetical protein LA080_011722 [Diaporthe eres]
MVSASMHQCQVLHVLLIGSESIDHDGYVVIKLFHRESSARDYRESSGRDYREVQWQRLWGAQCQGLWGFQCQRLIPFEMVLLGSILSLCLVLCSDTVVELVLDNEESVGRSAVELDGLVVTEDLVTLDERLIWTIEGLVVLGKLVMPDGTIRMVLEWVGPDKITGISEVVTIGELVVSTLERDGEAINWLADDVAPVLEELMTMGELVSMGELVAWGELMTTALEWASDEVEPDELNQSVVVALGCDVRAGAKEEV